MRTGLVKSFVTFVDAPQSGAFVVTTCLTP